MIKRASVFRLTYEALKKLFPKEDFSRKKFEKLIEIDKKDYWNRIVFTNYIQHYTAYQEGGVLDVDELGKTEETDKENLQKCMSLFDNEQPDYIIVLNEEEVFNSIKEILGQYNLNKNQSKPNCFYVLSRCSDECEEKYDDEILNEFIKYYVNNWEGITREDTMKIETLVTFIQPKYRGKYSLKKLREKIVKSIIGFYKDNNQQQEAQEMKDKYYKENVFNSNKFETGR